MEKDESTNFDNLEEQSLKTNKEKSLINQIMNYLHYEFHDIDLFSTNELERIIEYSTFSKQKTMHLLETYSKEEIMKMIEDFNLQNINITKSKSKDLSGIDVFNISRKFKEVYYVAVRKIFPDSELIQERILHAWSFINSNVNVIDLKDLLNSFDHHKLIKRAKSFVKDRDNKKLNDYFDKFTESREKKYQEMFKANLEENDMNFLQGDRFMEAEFLKKQKKLALNNITEKISKDIFNFYKIFNESNGLVKTNILEFLDIFSLGKLGLCNKNLNNLVFKKLNLEKMAKNYCLAIFKNLNLYVNEQEKIKYLYKNFMSMLAKRPRIRYGGIYYSRVRFDKVADNYGFSDQLITTVIFYRLYRFFPNGDIYSITTPFTKSTKIMSFINKNSTEIKYGRYFIDMDDTLIMELNSGKSYNFELKEYPNLKFKGLELIEYSFKSGNDITPVKLTEYFPKFFKFRSLDVLKNEVYIKKYNEFIN